MITLSDEGFNEYDAANTRNAHDLLLSVKSISEREGTILKLSLYKEAHLSLPLSRPRVCPLKLSP